MKTLLGIFVTITMYGSIYYTIQYLKAVWKTKSTKK